MATERTDRFATGLLLITLALCSLFLARGLNAMLAGKILGEQPHLVFDRAPTGAATPALSRQHDPSIILRRNIFLSGLGDLTQTPMDLPGGEAGQASSGDTATTECSVSMRLAGTTAVGGDLERSFAMIVGSDQEVHVHSGGAEVEGSTIRAIEPDSVVLETPSGGRCRLAMFDADGRSAKTGPSLEPPRPVKKAPPKKPLVKKEAEGVPTTEEIEAGVHRVNHNTYRIRREFLAELIDDAPKLFGLAAFRPRTEDGEMVGMEIGAIRHKVFERLGLRNADVIRSVNGKAISSPAVNFGAAAQLRPAKNFTVTVNRAGNPVTITYTVVEETEPLEP